MSQDYDPPLLNREVAPSAELYEVGFILDVATSWRSNTLGRHLGRSTRDPMWSRWKWYASVNIARQAVNSSVGKNTDLSDGCHGCHPVNWSVASYKNSPKNSPPKKMCRFCGCLKSHQPSFLFFQASPPHHRRRELPGEVKGCCDGVSVFWLCFCKDPWSWMVGWQSQWQYLYPL